MVGEGWGPLGMVKGIASAIQRKPSQDVDDKNDASCPDIQSSACSLVHTCIN